MNLNIDITTIIFAIILGHLFSAILGFSYMTHNKKDTAIYIFLLARLFDTLGWILLSLQGVVHNIALILIGNTFLILAHSLQILSFLKIKEYYNNFAKGLCFITSSIAIAIFYIFTLIYNANSGIRITIMSAASAIMWLYPEYVLLKDKKSSTLQRVIAFIYGCELILLFLRAYVGIVSGKSMNLTSTNIYNTLFFVGLYLVMLMGNIGFILMAKEKTDLALIKAAKYDELTEIFTRREFLIRAKNILSLCKAQKRPLSFLMIDLDYFKKINDAYGHTAGDTVLRHFSKILKAGLRENDLFGRFGGEEFAALLSDTDEKTALEIANRLRIATESSIVSIDENNSVKYTISIGIITVTPDEFTSLDKLYKLSDDALYLAKMNGKNKIEVFNMKTSASELSDSDES